MPTYTSRCPDCKRVEDFVTKVDARDAPRFCSCGAKVERILSAPSLHVFQAYQSPVTDKWIDSPAARRDDLRRNGCIEWEPGISQDMPSIRRSVEEKKYSTLDAAVDSTVRDMVAAGKIPPL